MQDKIGDHEMFNKKSKTNISATNALPLFKIMTERSEEVPNIVHSDT